MARSEPGRRWDLPRDVGFDWTFLGSRRVSRGETHLYLTAPGISGAISTADVVVIGGWESPANWRIIRKARRAGAAIILFYESTQESHRFDSGLVAAKRRRVLQSVDVVLTVGPASRDAVIAEGVAPERVVMGRNSVDDEIVHEARRLRAQRFATRDVGDAGTRESAMRYLFVGRLIKLKNVDGLLRAFAAVRQPAETLTIVGEGSEQDDLVRLADDLGLGEAVEFSGYRTGSELAAAYAQADCLVLPSSTEVWGMVVQEALDSGLSVVVSEHAGIVASLPPDAAVVVTPIADAALGDALVAARTLTPTIAAGATDAGGEPLIEAILRAVAQALTMTSQAR